MPFRARCVYALVLAAMLASCAGLEKSENVLSPTVAGPIPGVTIGIPIPMDPKDGRYIEVANQPVTLTLQNAPTNGERPLNYLFEVATDTSFTNKIFVRENIQPGADGRTTLRLSDALGTGRTYFWRGRAQDGANTGPYSGIAHFAIYTPISVDRPVPLVPVNNVMLDSLLTTFVLANAPRSGPVGAMSYILELADSDSFGNKFAVWTFGEQSGQTRFSTPSPLPAGRQVFWRARAYDTFGAGGDWSASAVFRTPAVQAPPPQTQPTGGSCTSAGTPLGVLQCRRNQFPAHMSHSQIVLFLRVSASDINRLGSEGGPWGILEKTSGANCDGFSCDILCLGNGGGQIQRDVLIDAEGSQTPIWGGQIGNPAIRNCIAQP